MPTAAGSATAPGPSLARRWLPLRAKLAALGLLGLVTAACVAGLSLRQMHRAATESARSLAAHTAGALALQLQYAGVASPSGGTDAQRFVDFVHAADGRDLELIDGSLRIVADADHDDLGKTVDGDEARVVAATMADGTARFFVEAAEGADPARHQVVVPLAPHGGQPAVGALVFEYTALIDEVDASATAARDELLAIFLPAGGLLLLLTLWGTHRLADAIRRLHAATVGLSRGERPRRIGRYGADELGDLAHAFDRMVDHLAEAEDALHAEVAVRRQAEQQVLAANAELEQRVAERTASLQQTNQQLDAELRERQRVERQLEQMARYDPLTGLPNRSLFMNQLTSAMERAKRSGSQLGLMFVDLDRFKSINDSLGHEIGDRVLQESAQRMRALLRHTDTVSRIGGDEFTVIVEGIAEDEAFATVANKLLEGFQQPIEVGHAKLLVTLSIGIATTQGDDMSVGDLMKQADFAMYQAKAEGRNNFQFHSARMGALASNRLAIESALRHALARQEFDLHYQVRVSAETGRPVGMEALLRWNSPELGAVPPSDFIGVAEDTGLIVPLGEWVLRTACTQHAVWRREGLDPGVIGINVSARQFRQPDLVERIVQIVAEAGARPQDIELEVTESTLMRDPEQASAMMSALRAHGFGIAIDDFGTGYSSLSHLKRFPATKIKIDRSFVGAIDSNADDAAIAAAIVALAGSLSIQVTAEGVETQGQLSHLSQLSCSEYQGFLFSQPLPGQSMREILRRGLRLAAEMG